MISDPVVAGDKAFNWEEEFPQIFKRKNLTTKGTKEEDNKPRTTRRLVRLSHTYPVVCFNTHKSILHKELSQAFKLT